MNTHAQKIVEALDALGKQIRFMEQRQPHVHYSLGSLWAKDKDARDALKVMQDELEAIGAGGVEPLRKRQCLHQIQEPQAMTHTSTEQMRAEFEALASDQGKWPKAIERDAKGDYMLMQIAAGWQWWQQAWQAATKQPDRKD